MIFTGLPQKNKLSSAEYETSAQHREKSTKRNNLSPTRYSFNHMSFYQKSIKPKNSLLYNQHFQMEIALLFLNYLNCKKKKNDYYLKKKKRNPQS